VISCSFFFKLALTPATCGAQTNRRSYLSQFFILQKTDRQTDRQTKRQKGRTDKRTDRQLGGQSEMKQEKEKRQRSKKRQRKNQNEDYLAGIVPPVMREREERQKCK